MRATQNTGPGMAFDAVVIGAGPAGSTAATILARDGGRRVAVLERQAFPRYAVGESLIPHCWFSLERLGVLDKMATAPFAVPKHSVQFASTDATQVHGFHFPTHIQHPCATTWQVRRADFDDMLAEHAADHGARFFFETSARSLVREGGRVTGVVADGPDGSEMVFEAPVVLDASGRNLFAVSRSSWRVADPVLRKIAVWTYYKNPSHDDVTAGATTIAYLPDKGWFWYIPLPDRTVSVGVVAEREYLYRDLPEGARDPGAIFRREVGVQRWIAERLKEAEHVGEYRVTGDYSYRSRHSAQDGLVLVGDAFAFLDPVFSSGVFLALRSGVLAGDAVNAALDAGDVSAARFSGYADRMCAEIEAMRNLVYAFYDQRFSFGDLMKVRPDLRSDLTECLIGNLGRDFSDLFDAVGRMAALPERLTHGRPLVTA